MSRVIISTSTSCLDYFDIPSNVRMIRNHVHIDGDTYLDGENISIDDMISIINRNHNQLVETSAPTETEIGDLIYELINEGIEEVLFVCVASELSKTHERVNNIKGLFNNQINIHVFDTCQIAYMEGLMVLEASRMLADDKSLYEIERRLVYMRSQISAWFMIDDLQNLIKTKRISAPAGYFANFMKIKPLLTFNKNGKIVPLERIRKTDVALERMYELAAEAIGNRREAHIYVMSIGDIELDNKIKNLFRQNGYENISIVPLAIAIISNIGTKGTCISVFVDDWQEPKTLKELQGKPES